MKKYFFIGIGGIGMSGLAKVLLEQGNIIFGSDPASNKQTLELESLGAKIYHQHDKDNISKDVDFVIVTSAVKNDNPEIARALELNIPIISRSKLLNEIITTNHKAIAITGTHGKTTTSSMLASILETAKLDPTAVIGAEVHTISGNAKSGKGDYAVAEVCEYQRAFLDIYPYGAIITNVEEDHLDCYKDLSEIITAFAEFTSHIDNKGFLVVYGEDKNIEKVIKDFKGEIIRYGVGQQNDAYINHLAINDHKTTFSVEYEGLSIDGFELQIPGIHNVLNALATTVVALKVGVSPEVIKECLRNFRGADRRFQILGEKDKILYVDDYAHHPTEIQATLKGAKNFYLDKRIIAVFQPHQHSRTKFLLDDFSKSFENADIVLIPEIYAVRDSEQDKKSVSSKDLVDLINKKSQKAKFFANFEETENYLRKITKAGDLVISIGAGPVNNIIQDIIANEALSTSKLDN